MKTINKNKKSFVLILGIIIIAVVCRIIPLQLEISNFAPFMAIALFGAAFFENKKWALIIPIAAWYLSDIALNLTLYASYYPEFKVIQNYQIWSFAAIVLIAVLGIYWFKKFSTKFVSLLGSGFIAAVIFFVISNFYVFISSGIYTKDISGLINCYVSAIPFFRNSLISNVLYLTVMVELYKYIMQKNLRLA